MTAIGRAGPNTPERAGGRAGDALWVVGTLGDSAEGLAQLRADAKATGVLVDVYRRPIPQLGAGQLIAPHAHAMMDVSDGLLLDAQRLAEEAVAPRRSTSTHCRCPMALPSAAEAASRRGCSRRRRAMIMRSSPRSRPRSTRQRFLYLKGRRLRASEGLSPVRRGSRSPAAVYRSNCRRHWVLSIRAISIGHYPIRQWLIGLSGLASGMVVALLLR